MPSALWLGVPQLPEPRKLDLELILSGSEPLADVVVHVLEVRYIQRTGGDPVLASAEGAVRSAVVAVLPSWTPASLTVMPCIVAEGRSLEPLITTVTSCVLEAVSPWESFTLMEKSSSTLSPSWS